MRLLRYPAGTGESCHSGSRAHRATGLQSRLDESDRLRRRHVERARYEAELAQRRYMRVDPENRLVADSLEADWNQKLRALTDAQQEYEERREQDRRLFDDEQRSAILALAQDLPRLWKIRLPRTAIANA